MNELSLFTGAGGGIWGTKLLGWRCLGYVEINDYCQRVISQRIADGLFEPAPIFGDIQAFNDQGYARRYRGVAEVVTAGFPCTPWSVAGKRRGEADSRNLWPATIATIREVRPRFAFLENVPALLANVYFGTILGDLAQAGYDAEWCVLGADDVGAPHRRKRLWILAHAQRWGWEQRAEQARRPPRAEADRLCEVGEAELAHAKSCRKPDQPESPNERGPLVGFESGADGRDCIRDSAERSVERERDQISSSAQKMVHTERKGLEKREGIAGDDGQECTPSERGGMRWWDIDPADLVDVEASDRGRAGDKADTGRRTSQTGGPDRTIREGPVESRVGKLADELADRKHESGATGEGEGS